MQARSTDFSYHGGRIDQAQRQFPKAPMPWLDLSTGVNPVAWQPPKSLGIDMGPLPLREDLAALEDAAASYFGTTPKRVAAVPGSEIALRLLPLLGAPNPIASMVPSYGTHSEISTLQISGSDLKTANPADTLLLANPNNPDGRIYQPDELLEIAQFRSEKGGWLAIDEAFSDANPEVSIVPHLKGDEPVIVFRSFGKFFGLAGLRLGFVIAPPEVIKRLHALLGDWPVSTHAIAYGLEAYRDSRWIAATRNALTTHAAELDACLSRHGLKPRGGCPLFRLVEHDDAQSLFTQLAERGILVRPFADHPRWLRFGLAPSPEALSRLDSALGND